MCGDSDGGLVVCVCGDGDGGVLVVFVCMVVS